MKLSISLIRSENYSFGMVRRRLLEESKNCAFASFSPIAIYIRCQLSVQRAKNVAIAALSLFGWKIRVVMVKIHELVTLV